MKINKEIRALRVRLIGEDGEQIGVFSLRDALEKAQEAGLDLVEIAPMANPPVCKISDYGKFRYQQTKREKLNRKAAHQVRIKEIKVKPNIDKRDLDIKIKRAEEFIKKGCKVKVTCVFRGREIVFAENGRQVLLTVKEALEDITSQEAPPKLFGKSLTMMLIPSAKEKKIAKEKKSVG